MLKYTILYKNGKTWNGKVKHVDDLDFTASDIVHITVKHSKSYTVLYPARGPWYDKESLRIEQVHLTRHISIPKVRTPNPTSKTKKQKAFDESYETWASARRPEVYIWGSGHAEYSKQAYKKWLWEQKNEKAVKVDKDGFIPWHGGEMPVPYGTMVHVKFRSGKEVICTAGYHPSSKQFKRLSDNWLHVTDWSHDNEPGDIVAYKVYEDPKVVEEKLNPLTPEITRITGSSCDPYPTIQVKAGDHSTPKIGSTRLMEIHGEVRECRFLGIEGLDEKWWVMLNKAPIKTTYTFWLGANGEIVDDK